MTKSKDYAAIDYFRLFGVILSIANHTAMLSSFSEIGDFVLTRVVARVVIPFFLMTSGFFLISRYNYNDEKLVSFIKKTAMIYGIAILIYIPINIYNGYFNMDNLFPNIIKDIIFDGTLYHLWYLPASIVGAVIAWYLVRRLNYPRALIIAFGLYCIGVFGDSYYGISEQIPFLSSLYNCIFQVTDYTRNGVFYAPIFFVLAGLMADRRIRVKLTLKCSALCFCVSFALMLGEALTLRHFGLQRHDSMYLFLLPCMFFLFSAVLCFRGKRQKNLRTLSLIIYIIHPMMIIVIRFISEKFHIQDLFVQNSIVHFLAVCVSSILFGVAAMALYNKLRPKKERYNNNTDRAYIEIDLNNLEHNAKILRRIMPPKCRLMAVVKAEAYGHSAFIVATHLEKIGVRSFAVATIDEGISLRKHGIEGEILILGYTDIHRAKELKKYNLMQTVISFDYAYALNKQNIPVKVHIKIDTGMHRLGIPFFDSQDVKKVFAMRNLKVCGIYTHLCCSNSLQPDDIAFTKEQIHRFYTLTDSLEKDNIPIPKLHIQSSYGLLNYPDLNCDYARIGIALYGVLSTPDDNTTLKLDLRPVLSLKARIVHIQTVSKGESVGYDRAFTAEQDSRIAILPIGYADGFPRNLSCGKGYALLGGKVAPIVGRICMDQLAVDVTDIECASVGSIATLIGKSDTDAIVAPMVADASGSITNELLSRMGKRLNVICTR